MQSITAFNTLDSTAAVELLTACLAVPAWAERIAAARPFETSEQLVQACQDGWWACNEAEKLDAFAAHPRIGDVELLRAKYASNAQVAQEKQGLANAEQGQVLSADDAVITELADQNNRYFDKFGFIFIVFATGRVDHNQVLIRIVPGKIVGHGNSLGGVLVGVAQMSVFLPQVPV